MSDLPSRDDVARMLGAEYSEVTKTAGWLLMGAYVSGRLVDRETIDHERIEEILVEFAKDWYDMVIREGGGRVYDFGAVIRALKEAIGDGDES